MNCEPNINHQGIHPFVVNVEKEACRNQNFRKEVWTGCYLQMTVMCIPSCGEIGVEVHQDADQMIRVEEGQACVKIGDCPAQLNFQKNLCKGDAVFIPAGCWHNIINTLCEPLKLSSVYAPPHHKRGTVDATKPEKGNCNSECWK